VCRTFALKHFAEGISFQRWGGVAWVPHPQLLEGAGLDVAPPANVRNRHPFPKACHPRRGSAFSSFLTSLSGCPTLVFFEGGSFDFFSHFVASKTVLVALYSYVVHTISSSRSNPASTSPTIQTVYKI